MAKPKTDEDYIALDEAIGVMGRWWKEIVDACARRGISERTASQVRQAMEDVHSPPDDEGVPDIFGE